MNVSTKKSTKKYAEFLLYGGKDVHLQPKIVINNNNSTEMKRIILSVLAIGLSMGVMAQTKSDAEISLASKKINVQTPKSTDIYTQFDESCATLDSIKFYQAQHQGQFIGYCTGQNLYGDTKYAEVYDFGQNVQILGIATLIVNMVEAPIEQNIPIQLMSSDFSSVLAESSVEATDLVEDFTTITFSSPVTASSVACVVETGELNVQSENDPFNLLAVASTPFGCGSGENSYSYSIVDDAGNYGWVTMKSGYNKDCDLFIFPIVEGTVGLSDVELNSLSYVYPNPAKSEVMLASSFKINKCEIVNVLGQLVFTSDVNANSIKVNTSDFAAGNYIVKMYTESGVATKKLVVE